MHNSNTWLICEPTSRWASAIRTALARDDRIHVARPRLREFRNLAEVANAISEAPQCLLCIEVGLPSLAAILQWLPRILEQYPNCRAIAILALGQNDSPRLRSVLNEAGFLDVAASPRDVRNILELGQRHDLSAVDIRLAQLEQLSIKDRLWAGLPWQPIDRPLG